MRSLDTNVVARFFIDDDDDEQAARQRPAAVAALSDRGFYGLSAQEVGRVFRALTGIEHLAIEDRAAVLAALDAHEKGVDFADALHLARSARNAAFITSDRRLAKRARGLGVGPEVELLA